MKHLVGIGVSAVIAVVALVGSASASAATEFGDACVGNTPAPALYTLATLSAPATSLPLAAPSSGVITQVKMQVSFAEFPPTFPTTLPEQVKVLRATGAKNTYTVTGQMTMEIHAGLNVAEARIPVQAGERLGVSGLPFAAEKTTIPGIELFCAGPGIEGTLGASGGNVPEGASAEFAEVTAGRVPLEAVIEPDADGDGFGDETQDKCPTDASTQGACPVPAPAAITTLSATSAVRKRLVSVTVTASAQATVTVGGTVALGKGKPTKLRGGTQIVAPGTLAKFVVLFPAKLKAKLKQLKPNRSVSLKLAVSAPGAAGSNLTVKVKGQKKAKRRRSKK